MSQVSQNSIKASQGGQSDESTSQSNAPSTPVNKRLLQLQKEGGKSPAIKVPASPMMTRLGYGTGVGVYLMERSPRSSGEIRSPWAIKRIAAFRKNSDNKVYYARLEHEARILKQLKHPNIIGFRAYSNSDPTGAGAYLALEKAPTSLADLIESRFEEVQQSSDMTPNPFPAKQIEKVGLDVGRALHYLHEEQKFIHGDLKSGNVLIFNDFETAKICDFGVARKLKEDGTVDGFYVGTEIWNPKEVYLALKGDTTHSITSKADIYPFGLTLFEMISLQPPHMEMPTETDASFNTSYNDSECSEAEKSFDESLLEEQLSQRIGTRPELPDVEFDDSYNKILEVFYCCTEEDPNKRPTAKHVVDLLEFTKAGSDVLVAATASADATTE